MTEQGNLEQTKECTWTVGRDEVILVTGATGFIGSRVVESLLRLGFRNVRCLARVSSDRSDIDAIADRYPQASIEVVTGNLLSHEDCCSAARDAALIYHLAAGTGQKSFPDAFMNSVVTTRNLLDAATCQKCLKRFVSVSSFAVYCNMKNQAGRLLDETCEVEQHPELRGEAYCFAKVKQEEFTTEYCRKFNVAHVVVRPGYVYGPGKQAISGRIGIDTFGVFLHLGGSNTIPLTYVDNCADAIALAGLTDGVDGEVFNVVDDDLPTSRQFLRSYKNKVKPFRSFYVPHGVSYALCWLWEWYSGWSQGQLPAAFNRKRWNAEWKKTRYSNSKMKARLGWKQKIPTSEGLRLYFEACRGRNA